MRWMLSMSALVVILPLLAGDALAAEKPGPYVKDVRWGFRVRTPLKWNQAAMSAKEKWIAGKYIGKRRLYPKAAEGAGDEPEMWVIGFPHARQENRGARSEKIGEDVTIIRIENPYKDYKDFLKRESWLAQGGFYFSKEEEAERGGVKIDVYEVKVEKMVDAPIRLITWVYHFDDVDFAIQFRIFEEFYDDYKGTIETCLKSFQEIKRTKPFPDTATTGSKIIETKSESELTPEERKQRRVQEVETLLRQEIDALPKGWYQMESDHYCALSHADKKFTKRTLAHAEAVRGYLDKTFAGMGTDFVPRGVIRVFATRAEENAFQQGTSSIWSDDVEQVLVTKGHGTDKAWEFEYLGRRVTRQWISFKNTSLYDGMPFWIREGLAGHMAFARPKGKRVEFKPDEYDREDLKKLIKEEKAIPLKELFQGDSDQFKEQAHLLQAGSVVSYLLGKGNRGKLKGSTLTYLKTLVDVIEEEDRKFEEEEKKREEESKKRAEEAAREGAENGGDGEEGLTDEEEEARAEEREARWKAYRERLKEMRETIRTRAFDAAFGKLQDKDWKKLDAAWQKFAG